MSFLVGLGALLLLVVDYGDCLGEVSMLLGVALRAQDGVWSACVCVVGLMAVLWAGAEECGRWEALQVLSACCLLRIYDFC